MTEIITIENKHRWDEITRSMNNYDFYHLSAYHSLDKTGEAILFHYQKESDEFVFPFLLRNIPETNYKDISSVYGYTGPLSKNETPSISNIQSFQNELKKYFEENNIVTIFARLHPFFDVQKTLLSNFGTIENSNLTIAVNLSLSETQQRMQYSHSLKNDINRLKEKIVLKEAKNKTEIDCFVDIYRGNMNRVNAAKNYYFSNEYFYRFLESIDSSLLLAYYEDKVIAGSLYTKYNKIIQSHLSATDNEYLKLSPLKYVWDGIRKISMNEGFKWMHLGGGFAGKNDTLFDFKSQFSKERFNFQIWKYIHNEEIYNELNERKFGNEQPDSSFFPLYRK